MRLPWWLVATVAAGVMGTVLWKEGALPGGVPDHAVAPRCVVPLNLHLDTVDPEFDLSRETVRAALDAAVAMWEAETPDRLFRYRPGAGMAVRLVFDERQATARSLDSAREELAQAQAEIARQEGRLDRLHAALEADTERFQRRLEAYRQQGQEYRQLVESWNAGRIDRNRSNRARLERDAETLESEQRQMEQQRRALERRRTELNRDGRALQRQIDAFNERVTALNRRIADTGGFDMALYRQENTRRSITVYKASDAEELRLILAHELGHALGIGHLAEATAVMHASLGAANASRENLGAADRRALIATCGVSTDVDDRP